MRVHRLRLDAFGSFAGSETIDFDRLGQAGLFLLTGPTGAGKTTVLDAVGFALYGQVPGDRDRAKRLRSDHASAGVATEVQLDFTVAGRRFEVTRRPEQQRPKTRGTGMTRDPAKVVLRERVDGRWLARSTRVGEADQLLQRVLGMSARQFFQVVLLPQGDFARFLTGDAEERRQLLEKLFGTSRFAAVEAWLREQVGTLRRALSAARAGGRRPRRAHRAGGGAGVPAGATRTSPGSRRYKPMSPSGRPRPRLRRRRPTPSCSADGPCWRCNLSLTHGRPGCGRRCAARRPPLPRLDRMPRPPRSWRPRGAPWPLCRRCARWRRPAGRRMWPHERGERRGSVRACEGESPELRRRSRVLRDEAAAARALEPLDDALSTARLRLGVLDDDAGQAASQGPRNPPPAGRRAQCAGRRGGAAAGGLGRRGGGARRPRQLADLERVHAAAVELARCDAEVEQLRDDLARAEQSRDELRGQWLDLREQRLDGIAGELACDLVDGGGLPGLRFLLASASHGVRVRLGHEGGRGAQRKLRSRTRQRRHPTLPACSPRPAPAGQPPRPSRATPTRRGGRSGSPCQRRAGRGRGLLGRPCIASPGGERLESRPCAARPCPRRGRGSPGPRVGAARRGVPAGGPAGGRDRCCSGRAPHGSGTGGLAGEPGSVRRRRGARRGEEAARADRRAPGYESRSRNRGGGGRIRRCAAGRRRNPRCGPH